MLFLAFRRRLTSLWILTHHLPLHAIKSHTPTIHNRSGEGKTKAQVAQSPARLVVFINFDIARHGGDTDMGPRPGSNNVAAKFIINRAMISEDTQVEAGI